MGSGRAQGSTCRPSRCLRPFPEDATRPSIGAGMTHLHLPGPSRRAAPPSRLPPGAAACPGADCPRPGKVMAHTLGSSSTRISWTHAQAFLTAAVPSVPAAASGAQFTAPSDQGGLAFLQPGNPRRRGLRGRPGRSESPGPGSGGPGSVLALGVPASSASAGRGSWRAPRGGGAPPAHESSSGRA